MKQNEVAQPLLTSRIIWGALNLSMLIYGFVLVTSGKAQEFRIPVNYTVIEIIALCSTLLLFVTFNIHEKKVKPISSMEKRFPYYVVCWALHETIVVIAFVAVFLGGNMLVFVLNFVMALFGNFMTFPKAPLSKH